MSPAGSSDREGRTPARGAGLGSCLVRLDEAIAAAAILGLDTAEAEAVREEADVRLGLGSDVYALAFVGGTGVGKSSLLNGLAQAEVSPASVRRPTTDLPIAWIPANVSAGARTMLERLGIAEVHEHREEGLGGVAILDLPDLDSVAGEHRARVEDLLPKLDAVVWVTDPEKYHDAVLHDDFLRTWLPRLDRQLVVLNKSDRLAPADAERIRADLQRDLRAATGRPGHRPPVVVASTRRGASGLEELRHWLGEGIEAKVVVANRLAAAGYAAIEGLARRAGVDADGGSRPMLSPEARSTAVDDATEAILRVVDLPALEAKAVAATRARARRSGSGPVGRVTSLVYRASGREARVADPVGHLRRWRDRGSPMHAVEALRAAAMEPLGRMPPAIRPALASATDPALLSERLGVAVDRVVAQHAETRAPSSRLWPLMGLLQTLNLLVLLFAVGWVVFVLLADVPVAAVEVPVLGPVPVPYLLLATSLLAGLLLTRLLGLHGGWMGRRWARHLRGQVREAVERSVAADAYGPMDRLEAARRALWISLRARADCLGR
jgi:hypothetical protein